ncbi:hypothetical protein Pmani_018610 [Petrolisthes manimaculis]|uniref:Uncharacterized protein n=1 Tax=Petrolisthes manimaculis TaxID=1843537 RepID=A0AAE1PJF6_9EUCA|nr:hypothetical protein Pmani_018610 [Petrolisthes manimaculis]
MKDLNNSLASKDKSLRQSRKSSSSPSPSPSSGYRDDQPLIDPQQYATPDQYGYSPETASQRYSPEGVPQQQQQQQQQQQGQHNTLSDTERQRYQEEFEQRYYSESVPLDYSHETQQYNSESATVPSEGETRNSYAEGEESRGGAGGGPWPSRMSLGSLVGYLMSGAAKKVGLTKGPKLPEYER